MNEDKETELKSYTVEVREVQVKYMHVLAENEDDAINRVHAGEGNFVFTEYSHDMDPESWEVYEN